MTAVRETPLCLTVARCSASRGPQGFVACWQHLPRVRQVPSVRHACVRVSSLGLQLDFCGDSWPSTQQNVICLLHAPRSVDAWNLSCGIHSRPLLSVNDLQDLLPTFNNVSLSPHTPPCSSSTPISSSTSSWWPALSFTSTVSRTSRSSAS